MATLASFRCYKPKPHRIFLPQVYEKELRFIHSRVDDKRELSVADGDLPCEMPSLIKVDCFDFARVARISVHQAGADFVSRLDELEAEALQKGVVVNQIWLNFGEPWIAAAVSILRDRGYFFGGVFPRWLDHDGLFLQELLCPPYFEEIKLVSDRSRELWE